MNKIKILILILICFKLQGQNDSITIWSQKIKDSSTDFDKANLNASLSHAYLNKNIDSSKALLKTAQTLFPASKTYQTQK